MAKVSLRVYNREIEAMIDRGQLDEAIAHCQHILKTFPKHLETYRLLGKAYLEYKRYNEAVDIFSRVLAAEPNDFVANVGLSIIRDEQSKMDDAIWHMERAFETQPSNPAIQSELQRLYGRRDGVQPPRIRMTRGALAHMYVQGELYPQAISEIKSVLKEDQGRSDMSVLLARAYYRSGQKNQAADEAAAVLRRYPYCLDANRVLVEIAGADRPETAQVYRQRVIELDPYAAQVTGTVFQSNEVGDNAVALEHLEWNGQAAPAQSNWDAAKAIAPQSGLGFASPEPAQASDAEPDWLKMGGGDSNAAPPLTGQPTFVPPVSEAPSAFDSSPAAEPAQLTPEDQIPEWMRAAGWGQSTGEFDESKSVLPDEAETPSSAGGPLEQGDLPDWVKAMAPPPTTDSAAPTPEDELPDWIKNIGTGALSSSALKPAEDQADWLKESDEPAAATTIPSSGEQPDWMQGFDQPAQPAAAEEQPDWMKGMEQQPSAPESLASDDSMDWLKGLDQPESAPQSSADTTAMWLKGLDDREPAQPAATNDLPDWLSPAEQPETSQPAAVDDSMDWLKGLDQPDSAPQSSADTTAMWLKGLDEPKPEQAAASNEQPDWMQPIDEGPQQPAQSEVPDWPEGLGSEQEAAPEAAAPMEQPDWSTQFGSLAEGPAASAEKELEFLEELSEKPAETSAPAPIAGPQDLGKSEQERDDSFAWLEALAANQGASEGLLTKPEDRLQEEPDWVKQAKGITPTLAESAPVQPQAKQENLDKSQQEIDDSLAWLENLAAKQGATEGLLTKPEDRLEQEPEWVKQAKSAPQTPAAEPAASKNELGKSQQEIDDSLAWLENLAAKQGATEGLLTKPEERLQEEPEWVKQAKSAPLAAQPPVEPAPAASTEDLGKSEQERDDSFAWLENLAAKQGATEGLLTKPEDRREEEPDWVKQAKGTPEPSVPQAPGQPAASTEDLGKSEQERDDSFAWLENLAAKQGATEGLLTKPEDRREEEPDWVKQAKGTPEPSVPQAPGQPAANVEDLGKSEQERDDSFAWLENLAAKQGATEGLLTEPEERLEQEPDWVKQAKSAPQQPAEPEPVMEEPVSTTDDTTSWLRNLEQEETVLEPESSKDETAMWFQKLEETPQEPEVSQPEPADDLPSWLKGLEEEAAPEPTRAADTTMMWLKGLDEPEVAAPQETAADNDVPAWLAGIDEEEKAAEIEALAATASAEARGDFDWLNEIEEEPAAAAAPSTADEDLPSWLRGVEEETRLPETGALRNLAGWMRDEMGEVMAEPTKIEPTRATDWQPSESQQPEPPKPEAPPTAAAEQPVEEPTELKPAPKKSKPAAEPKPEPYKEPLTTRGAAMAAMSADPMLGSARNELTRSNIPGALQAYEKLIKKGRFLDEVIYDLREALYRYPVEVSIWQALGDAYMRANRLQDALDAYTKAEELLR